MKHLIVGILLMAFSAVSQASTWRATCHVGIYTSSTSTIYKSTVVQAYSSTYVVNPGGYYALYSPYATDYYNSAARIVTGNLANACKAYVQSQANLYRVKAAGYWRNAVEVETGITNYMINGSSDFGISTGTGLVSPSVYQPAECGGYTRIMCR
jgi:hypothetical protein